MAIVEAFRAIALEEGGDGTFFRAGLDRVQAYSKISRRTIQKVLHGGMPGCDESKPGLRKRRILLDRAPHSAKDNLAATYVLNVAALKEDARMRRYVDRLLQRRLPNMEGKSKTTNASLELPMTFLPPTARAAVGGIQLETPLRQGLPGATATAAVALRQGLPGATATAADKVNDLMISSTPTVSSGHQSFDDPTILSMAGRVPLPEVGAPFPITAEESNFATSARRFLLAQSCVQCSWSRSDVETAAELFRSGVSLADLEHAIELGCVRKYTQAFNTGVLQHIVSLRYFQGVLDEIAKTNPPMSSDYWRYTHHTLEKFEQQWNSRGKG
jgi:hypothetical protein